MSRLVPAELVWMRGRPVAVLRELPPGPPRGAFWHEAKATLGGRPVLVPLERAPEPSREPRGFVFHMMRCGSTLVARMLQATGRVVALSEPVELQDLLAHPAWLRRMMGLYQAAFPDLPVVVKWSSRATRFLPVIQREFPGVPCLFVHRDPVEVLVSALQAPPAGRRGDPETLARELGAICRAASEAPGLRRVDYASLPGAAVQGIPEFFGLAPGEEERRRAWEAAGQHAHHGGAFVPDTLRKQRDATPGLRALADRFVRPELERAIRNHPALGEGSR